MSRSAKACGGGAVLGGAPRPTLMTVFSLFYYLFLFLLLTECLVVLEAPLHHAVCDPSLAVH